MSRWSAYLAVHRERFRDELLEFLRIPSVSALPEQAGEVQRAARWCADRLSAAGLEKVEILPTGGHPVVTAEWQHAPGKPTILLYGHFDVQPVDPVNLWMTPPFEPTIRDGRVYARGASDMKGNLLLQIVAIEALLKTTGGLPVNLKFFYEGQEEIGSPEIPRLLTANKERFRCDLVVSADGGQWSVDQPSLTIAHRGLAGIQIDLQGATSDLHSGMYGGIVQNPIHALVALLASMRGPDGRILVAGFYDDVVEPTEAERARVAAVPFDEAATMRELGVDALFGEAGYSPRERNWLRPTLEVNGIWGGFQGAGSKTVLPNEAHAKITCRLVPDQDPDGIVDQIVAHVARHATPGVRVSVTPSPGRARPYYVPPDHPGNRAAAAVLTDLYGKPPYYEQSGGTVPVTELFLRDLEAYTISFGFGLPDEPLHAPNEFYRLASFERGQTAYCMLLERLASLS